MFTNPLENDLAAEAAFLAASVRQCSCQDYCFHSSAQGNFLQIISHDNQVLRENFPLEREKISGRFRNSSIILLVILNEMISF